MKIDDKDLDTKILELVNKISKMIRAANHPDQVIIGEENIKNYIKEFIDKIK